MTRWLLPGGLAALVLGQAGVVAAFLIPGLFTPGTWLIGLGLLALAVAGVANISQTAE